MFCTYSKNYYEGRSINKLQNDIILLIFKIWKFRNIHFVVNLIGDIYWNFYDDDSLLWTSLILRTHWLTSQCCILPSNSLLQLASVEQHCELNEKSEQVQQANVFKRQTLMFHFSTYRPNSFKHLSHHTPVWPHEGIDPAIVAPPLTLLESTMSKLFTPNKYCWSCKYWMHLRLNGICAKSFCPQQTKKAVRCGMISTATLISMATLP